MARTIAVYYNYDFYKQAAADNEPDWYKILT